MYHVLNRAVGRATIFDQSADYAAFEEVLRRSVKRGAPYGDEPWQEQAAQALGQDSALRPPGQPRKQKEGR